MEFEKMDSRKIASTPEWLALEKAVRACWQYVGSDAEQCAEECGQRMNNASRIEVAVDADRLSTCVNAKVENEYFKSMCKTYGYTQVAKLLGNRVKL